MGYQGQCEFHGPYFNTVLCSECIREIFTSPSTYTTSSVAGPFSLLRPPVIPEELKPVSLGRWEEQTDNDREFLQACGISQE